MTPDAVAAWNALDGMCPRWICKRRRLDVMLSLWRMLLPSSLLLVPLVGGAAFVAIAGAAMIIFAPLAFVRRLLRIVGAHEQAAAGAGA